MDNVIHLLFRCCFLLPGHHEKDKNPQSAPGYRGSGGVGNGLVRGCWPPPGCGPLPPNFVDKR